MKKIFILLILFTSFFLIQGNRDQTYAIRYTTCDQCGLCISPSSAAIPDGDLGKLPDNWDKCRACLYPGTTTFPHDARKTLIIPDTADANGLPINIAPTIEPGHYYTAVGCLTTNVGDFSKPGAAAGVITPILNMMFSLAGGIAFLYLMYGAFLVLTSRGDFEQLNQGKRTVYGSIIGLIFTLSSVFVINLLANGVLKIPGFG